MTPSATDLPRYYHPVYRTIFLAVTPLLLALAVPAYPAQPIQWDFKKGPLGWKPNTHIKQLTPNSQGITIQSTANDPWIASPPFELPAHDMLRVTITLKSNADRAGRIFYGLTFTAGRSVPFTIHNDNRWHTYTLLIKEPLGPRTRLRLDPCTSPGTVTISSITIEPLTRPTTPPLSKPQPPAPSATPLATIRSGPLQLHHYGNCWANFSIHVTATRMALAHNAEHLGIQLGQTTCWIALKDATFSCRLDSAQRLLCSARFKDPGGATWKLQRCIQSADPPGTILIQTQVQTDKDRQLVYLPWITLLPGLGTFGSQKDQALFAGLEYLADEPSSSTADITTPEHIRRIPDPIKITFPLMSISAKGRYIGLIWQPSSLTAAAFDSPDRIFDTGAHLISLSAPAVGPHRFENDLVAHTPFTIKANTPIQNTVWIIAGPGKTIVPSVQHYLQLNPLPPLPSFQLDFNNAVTLLAHGWLDSRINENGLFRHAVWANRFPPGPAADAAMYIDWLANHTPDTHLRTRLLAARDLALTKIPQTQPFSSSVSHITQPTAPLIFGRAIQYAAEKTRLAETRLRNFDQTGIKHYQPGRIDYSRTHFADHANGYAAADLVAILTGAIYSSDPNLLTAALELLDKQTDLYADTVPRGAQTWEVPLHTPDILASAHLTKAYTLGYIISGNPRYLQQARYWAWTGLPFVYLYPPTDQPVGTYATIAVLGATNWRAPIWFGRPVQWCGLVYASALHLLSQYDPVGPWQKIAKGITATGLQMCWPLDDKARQGLLPDFYLLRSQLSDGPAINPGTVQAHLPELYEKGKIYDLKKLPHRNCFIHAPCAITHLHQTPTGFSFTVAGWADKPYHVLITHLTTPPHQVLINDQPSRRTESPTRTPLCYYFSPRRKILLINLQQAARITIR